MCDKIPYDTKEEARQTAIGMSRDYNQSMKTYYCYQCEAWHIATCGKSRKRRRNNNKYPFRFTYRPKKEKRDKRRRA